MKPMKNTLIHLSLAAFIICGSAGAEANRYGPPISLELAKKVALAASAEMHNRQLELTIAIVDSGGNLIYLERANQAPLGTVDAAIGKARAANGIKAATKVLEDQILGNNKLNLLGIPGAFPVEGGVPLIINKQIVGAIGASGASPVEDGVVANEGAKSLLP
ncbi:GlcG/HbpS family heme-binding protein [Undibacterium sp. Ji49W]|uniref:GlcG/HbpS family heme-binding protein n=1 Tax=Undibacterium sp. Ji49W TaxID=3413040 RepID=UPI003BF232CA